MRMLTIIIMIFFMTTRAYSSKCWLSTWKWQKNTLINGSETDECFFSLSTSKVTLPLSPISQAKKSGSPFGNPTRETWYHIWETGYSFGETDKRQWSIFPIFGNLGWIRDELNFLLPWSASWKMAPLFYCRFAENFVISFTNMHVFCLKGLPFRRN